MNDHSRRSFVKTSAATGLTFTFAGLIRAHGQSGGGTTWYPEETFGTDVSTTWNQEATYVATTWPGNTYSTTTDPNGSYGETTNPYQEYTTTYDPNVYETTQPETEIQTTALQYEVIGKPAGAWHPGLSQATIDGWNIQIIASSTPLVGRGKTVIISCYVQTWHNNDPAATLKNHIFCTLQGSVADDGSFTSTANLEHPITYNDTLQVYEDPPLATGSTFHPSHSAYDYTCYDVEITTVDTDFSSVGTGPFRELKITAKLRKQFIKNTTDDNENNRRIGGDETNTEETVLKVLSVERTPP